MSCCFWLEEYIGDFLDSLDRKGYARNTIEQYKYSANHICHHVEAIGMGPEDLDTEFLDALATTCPCTGSGFMNKMLPLTARCIADDLVVKGIITRPPKNASLGGPREHLILEWDNWLKFKC